MLEDRQTRELLVMEVSGALKNTYVDLEGPGQAA